MNPAIEQLRRLCRFGFTGERLFNQDSHLELVHYTRHFRPKRPRFGSEWHSADAQNRHSAPNGDGPAGD